MVFQIGEFSKIAQVTTRQLRFYDQLGLLVPQHVEPGGRRYYGAGQLSRLNRILALKDLGFSLEQVRALLHEDVPLEELRGMLRLKRAESERRLQDETRRYRAIEARLEQIARGDDVPLDVVLKPVECQRWLSVRGTVGSLAEAQGVFERVVEALSAPAFAAEGFFVGVLHSGEIDADALDVEVGRVLRSGRASAAACAGLPLRQGELAGAADMASFVHEGPHDEIHLAYGAVGRWLQRTSYRIAGPLREVFVRLPAEPGGRDAITEIQFPVERRADERTGFAVAPAGGEGRA